MLGVVCCSPLLLEHLTQSGVCGLLLLLLQIVSHSSFLHFLMTNFGLEASTLVQGELHKWFENCELRTIVVADEQAMDKQQDPGHFPGFAAAVKEGPSV